MISSGYVFFIKNGKILLMRRKNTGYMDGHYGLPAGHIEEGETLSAGTCREMVEEVGIDLKEKNIELAHVMHRKSNDIRIDFFFVAKKWKDTPKNNEPEKCDDLQWFDLDALPKNTIPYIKTAIENYRSKIIFSEYGW